MLGKPQPSEIIRIEEFQFGPINFQLLQYRLNAAIEEIELQLGGKSVLLLLVQACEIEFEC